MRMTSVSCNENSLVHRVLGGNALADCENLISMLLKQNIATKHSLIYNVHQSNFSGVSMRYGCRALLAAYACIQDQPRNALDELE